MILVTGATGFIGGHLVPRLLADGHSLRALVRPTSARQFLEKRGVDVVVGDIATGEGLAAAVDGIETIVHLVGLMQEPADDTFESVVAEGTRALVNAAEKAGVQRFVYVSSQGARPDAISRYHRTKAIAEAAIRRHAFDHVILRPTIVYGPGDELVRRFSQQLLPIPGDGKNLVQPVHVDDVVEVLAQSVTRPDVVNRTFELGGPEAMTFNRMVRRIREASGGRIPNPHVPMPLAEAQAWLFDTLKKPLSKFGFPPPVTRDQLLLLTGDVVCDNSDAQELFDLELTRFEDGVRTATPVSA